MNIVSVESGELVVQPQGLDKLWTFTGELRIPLSHITDVAFAPDSSHLSKGLRGPGVGLPGRWAGTYRHEGSRSWWNVAGDDRTVRVDLAGEAYDHLYLTVEDPAGVVRTIDQARGVQP